MSGLGFEYSALRQLTKYNNMKYAFGKFLLTVMVLSAFYHNFKVGIPFTYNIIITLTCFVIIGGLITYFQFVAKKKMHEMEIGSTPGYATMLYKKSKGKK